MFDVATFLMRWLFVSNLLRNAAEILTFPQLQTLSQAPQQEQHLYNVHQPFREQTKDDQSDSSSIDPVQREANWRNRCLQTILSYPPGTIRLIMADAYRVELVQKMADQLTMAQACLRQHRLDHLNEKPPRFQSPFGILRNKIPSIKNTGAMASAMDVQTTAIERPLSESFESDPNGPVSSFESVQLQEKDLQSADTPTRNFSLEQERSNPASSVPPSNDETVRQARHILNDFKEFVPQLVSAVLKSPSAVDPAVTNPTQALRQLLLDRCYQDPSWGIELCWMLEADVGRAWKTLLEHPQQTGRRLLVILPREKAAVLAKIGLEKTAAFDLLQDAEEATAYGYPANNPAGASADSLTDRDRSVMDQHDTPSLSLEPHLGSVEPHWPSGSLRQRRCAHFGDTMHFIDRLTKLSLDLKKKPPVDRHAHLINGLRELNRRIRRRMVTKGEISLDVEDHYGPDDWPRVEDLETGMIQHSVHFPLNPKSGSWHTGQGNYDSSRDDMGVVRVLNIVIDESRLLSSRERCPFLINLEVVDTGLEGHDERLYATGVISNVESTLKSTLEGGLSMTSGSSAPSDDRRVPLNVGNEFPHEIIPTTNPPPPRYDLARGGSLFDQTEIFERVDHPGQNPTSTHEIDPQHFHSSTSATQGYNEPQVPYPENLAFQNNNQAYRFTDSTSVAHQQVAEHLYDQIQERKRLMEEQEQLEMGLARKVGPDLLDEVFGDCWAEKCKKIKETSRFGSIHGWRLASFIMKAGEDIRQESLVMQVISMMRNWFDDEIPYAYRPSMRPYTIMCVGGDAGLVECLSDAKSVDEVKKKAGGFISLRDFFERAYGLPGATPFQGQISFERAQDNFLRSLVGYSLVCFVLQIKDRHNANILLDRDGHIMHIDFGFVLGDTPKMGKVPIFSERAPFKLSAEFWDVLGGWNTKSGGLGVKFCKMFEMAFQCASRHVEEIATLVETTMMGLNYDARSARIMANGVRMRLRMRGAPGSLRQKQFIVELISDARASWGTSTYDWLQKNMNGYQ